MILKCLPTTHFGLRSRIAMKFTEEGVRLVSAVIKIGKSGYKKNLQGQKVRHQLSNTCAMSVHWLQYDLAYHIEKEVIRILN